MNITTLELINELQKKSAVQLKNLDDLELDVSALQDWSGQWGPVDALWLVKESGTVLLPLKKCVNPVFVDCAYDVSCQGFVINVEKGTFTSVTESEAKSKIMELPRSIEFALTLEEKELAIRTVLKNKFVTDWLLVRASLDEKSPLSSWLSYFQRICHPLMEKLLREVC